MTLTWTITAQNTTLHKSGRYRECIKQHGVRPGRMPRSSHQNLHPSLRIRPFRRVIRNLGGILHLGAAGLLVLRLLVLLVSLRRVDVQQTPGVISFQHLEIGEFPQHVEGVQIDENVVVDHVGRRHDHVAVVDEAHVVHFVAEASRVMMVEILLVGDFSASVAGSGVVALFV